LEIRFEFRIFFSREFASSSFHLVELGDRETGRGSLFKHLLELFNFLLLAMHSTLQADQLTWCGARGNGRERAGGCVVLVEIDGASLVALPRCC
jgi:hypothetical protein